jgi:hypothetical protein
MRLKWIEKIVAFFVLAAAFSVAQIPAGFVKVTATVPSLANGAYGAAWTNLSSSSQLALLGGLSTFQQTVNGTFDASGSATMLLADTAQIIPSPSTWTFQFSFSCPTGSPSGGFFVAVAVTGGGGTEDISSQITAALPTTPCGGALPSTYVSKTDTDTQTMAGGLNAPTFNGSVNSVINVMSAPYNAKCDGSTDDSVALQASINAAETVDSSNAQSAVLIPSGHTCVFGTTLYVASSGINSIFIQGGVPRPDNTGSILAYTGSGNAIEISDGGSSGESVTIDSLEIECKRDLLGTNTCGTLINIGSVDGPIYITNDYISGEHGYSSGSGSGGASNGIVCAECGIQISIKDNLIFNFLSAAVKILRGTNVSIANNQIFNAPVGVYAGGVGPATISYNYFELIGYGIELTNSYDWTRAEFDIHDNQFNLEFSPPLARDTSTSSSSVTIGTGTLNFTVSSGLGFYAGETFRASYSGDSTPTNWVQGTVSSYSGTSLVINSTSIGGSGTYSAWDILAGGQMFLGTQRCLYVTDETPTTEWGLMGSFKHNQCNESTGYVFGSGGISPYGIDFEVSNTASRDVRFEFEDNQIAGITTSGVYSSTSVPTIEYWDNLVTSNFGRSSVSGLTLPQVSGIATFYTPIVSSADGDTVLPGTTYLPSLGSATSTTNYSSNTFIIQSSYWTGSASNSASWSLSSSHGSGSNPSNNLNLSFSGDSSYTSLVIGANLQVTGGGYYIGSNEVIPSSATGYTGSGKVVLSTSPTFTGTITDGSNTIPTVGSTTAGQASCTKSVGPPVIIGYCSTVVSSSGSCTCN